MRNIGGTAPNQIFGGDLRSATTCRACGIQSERIEYVEDIALNVQGDGTLTESLTRFFARETIQGVHCQSCRRNAPVTREYLIERPPTVLCLQLRWFQEARGERLAQPYRIDSTIDLAQFSHGRSRYRLVSVIVHYGDSPNQGHYLSYATGPDGRFRCFNDAIVTPATLEEVLVSKPYIVFYELISPQRLQMVAHCMEATQCSEDVAELALNDSHHDPNLAVLRILEERAAAELPLENVAAEPEHQPARQQPQPGRRRPPVSMAGLSAEQIRNRRTRLERERIARIREEQRLHPVLNVGYTDLERDQYEAEWEELCTDYHFNPDVERTEASDEDLRNFDIPNEGRLPMKEVVSIVLNHCRAAMSHEGHLIHSLDPYYVDFKSTLGPVKVHRLIVLLKYGRVRFLETTVALRGGVREDLYKYATSHLCSCKGCIAFEHIVVELQGENEARKQCVALWLCVSACNPPCVFTDLIRDHYMPNALRFNQRRRAEAEQKRLERLRLAVARR